MFSETRGIELGLILQQYRVRTRANSPAKEAAV